MIYVGTKIMVFLKKCFRKKNYIFSQRLGKKRQHGEKKCINIPKNGIFQKIPKSLSFSEKCCSQ